MAENGVSDAFGLRLLALLKFHLEVGGRQRAAPAQSTNARPVLTTGELFKIVRVDRPIFPHFGGSWRVTAGLEQIRLWTLSVTDASIKTQKRSK